MTRKIWDRMDEIKQNLNSLADRLDSKLQEIEKRLAYLEERANIRHEELQSAPDGSTNP